jgi:hypothetical protein
VTLTKAKAAASEPGPNPEYPPAENYDRDHEVDGYFVRVFDGGVYP